MKRPPVLLCSGWLIGVLCLSGCESTALLEDLLSTSSGESAGELSNATIADGLREALTVGSGRVVNSLGAQDGFFESAFRIPLPEKLQQAKAVASRFGFAGTFDELELKLNRAAEAATPKARDLFVSAIKQMSFSDVLAIYRGPEDSATQYLRQTTSDDLASQMRPVVENSLSQVGAVQTFQALVKRYNALPLVTPIDSDVTSHVLGYSQNAIFSQLAEEEAAIRKDPLKRSTALLKTVFGG